MIVDEAGMVATPDIARLVSLAQKYDVQLVVVFTGILERDRSPFFDLLMADKGCEATPSWLEPVLGTQDLIVFQVKESVRLSSSN